MVKRPLQKHLQKKVMTFFVMQLQKVTILHTWDQKLGSQFLMVLDQFQKQFWNPHAKT